MMGRVNKRINGSVGYSCYGLQSQGRSPLLFLPEQVLYRDAWCSFGAPANSGLFFGRAQDGRAQLLLGLSWVRTNQSIPGVDHQQATLAKLQVAGCELPAPEVDLICIGCWLF